MHEPLHYSAAEIGYRDRVRQFVDKEIAPHVAVMDSEDRYPFELLQKLGEEGYIGVRFPVVFGGTGKDLLHETLVNEQVGRASIAMACARSCVSYVAHAINSFGTDEQKRKYLPRMFAGEWPASECITEAHVGSDAARMRTVARREGDHYVLHGEKRFQANGGVAKVMLVYAITDSSVNPREGMSAFILEKGWPGLHTARNFKTLGYRGLEVVSEMVFKDVRVPVENLVGLEGQGWEILMTMLDSERVIVAASFIGAAQACLEIAVKYSDTRVAFHKRIREWEGTSYKIADMATAVDSARPLCVQAARMIDRGINATKEAAMAKLVATEGAFGVISDAMQIMGGIGYTTDYPIERHFRDARNGLFVAGSSEMMRLIIQRETYSQIVPKAEK
jgi:alkylation response protein AidB-like acyl-CoA dehydrogenase